MYATNYGLEVNPPHVSEVDSTCLSILSHKQAVGMTVSRLPFRVPNTLDHNYTTPLQFVSQSGLISATAVLLFFTIIIINFVRNVLYPPHGGPWKLIRTHVDAYMLSLMLADLLQGIGAMMTIKWSIEQRVYCGGYCTAQGVIQQLGEAGVAMNTLAITLHTFFAVFFRCRPPPWLWKAVVASIWTFLGGFIGIAYMVTDPPYYAPTPYWCWISETHDAQRIFGEYMWMWLAALTNIILYVPLFFCVRGNISVHSQTKKISFNFGLLRRYRSWRMRRMTSGSELGWDRWDNSAAGWKSGFTGVADARGPAMITGMRTVKEKNREALKLVWYPVTYTALILPISIVRWSTFPHRASPDTPVADLPVLRTALTVFVFGLSGLVNVLVFLSTRPNLLLFGPRRGLVHHDSPRETPRPSPPVHLTPGSESRWPLTQSPGYVISPNGGTPASKSSSFPFSLPGTPAFATQYTPMSPYGSLALSPPSISGEEARRYDTDGGLRVVRQRPACMSKRQDSEDGVLLQEMPSSSTAYLVPKIQLQRPPERAHRKSVIRNDQCHRSTPSIRSRFYRHVLARDGPESEPCSREGRVVFDSERLFDGLCGHWTEWKNGTARKRGNDRPIAGWTRGLVDGVVVKIGRG